MQIVHVGDISAAAAVMEQCHACVTRNAGIAGRSRSLYFSFDGNSCGIFLFFRLGEAACINHLQAGHIGRVKR